MTICVGVVWVVVCARCIHKANRWSTVMVNTHGQHAWSTTRMVNTHGQHHAWSTPHMVNYTHGQHAKSTHKVNSTQGQQHAGSTCMVNNTLNQHACQCLARMSNVPEVSHHAVNASGLPSNSSTGTRLGACTRALSSATCKRVWMLAASAGGMSHACRQVVHAIV